MHDLIKGYTDEMQNNGKRSYRNVRRCLEKDVSKAIGDYRANAVEPEQITEILFKVINRGAEVHANRLRSYLHSAFQYGIKHDNDPKRMGSLIKYKIQSSPVRNVPKDSGVEVGELKVSKSHRYFLQNHAKVDVSSKHYDRYDYLEEKQVAINIWCEYLERLVDGNNVIPLIWATK